MFQQILVPLDGSELAERALPPAGTIIDGAGTDKLVVLATHGRSRLTRWALGSVADRVAHGGAAAVLLVRAGAAPHTP
jgi:nucleotide-binding universal stress UspA family protein